MRLALLILKKTKNLFFLDRAHRDVLFHTPFVVKINIQNTMHEIHKLTSFAIEIYLAVNPLTFSKKTPNCVSVFLCALLFVHGLNTAYFNTRFDFRRSEVDGGSYKFDMFNAVPFTIRGNQTHKNYFQPYTNMAYSRFIDCGILHW